MELYFLRHAIAAERGHFEGKDSSRPLTEEGVEKMKKAARGLKKLKLEPDAVLSSPFERAAHTAEIVSRVLDLKLSVRYEECLTPTGSAKVFLNLLKKFPADSKLLIVGHQPSLGEFISALVFGHSTLTIDLKKGGLCRVDIPSPEAGILGELKWLLTSSHLRGMA